MTAPFDAKLPRPDRANLKTVVTYLPHDVAKRLKMIAVSSDRTVQRICEEAIMDWMDRHSPDQPDQTKRRGKQLPPIS